MRAASGESATSRAWTPSPVLRSRTSMPPSSAGLRFRRAWLTPLSAIMWTITPVVWIARLSGTARCTLGVDGIAGAAAGAIGLFVACVGAGAGASAGLDCGAAVLCCGVLGWSCGC
jgi:hypothetical protein